MSKANLAAYDRKTKQLLARAEYDPLTRRSITVFPDGKVEPGFRGPFADAFFFAAEQVSDDPERIRNLSFADDVEEILEHFPRSYKNRVFTVQIDNPIKYKLASMTSKRR